MWETKFNKFLDMNEHTKSISSCKEYPEVALGMGFPPFLEL